MYISADWGPLYVLERLVWKAFFDNVISGTHIERVGIIKSSGTEKFRGEHMSMFCALYSYQRKILYYDANNLKHSLRQKKKKEVCLG